MSGPPRLSEEEREVMRARQELAGWRPREQCECDEPEPGFAGGDGYYITEVCLACRRRLHFDEPESAA